MFHHFQIRQLTACVHQGHQAGMALATFCLIQDIEKLKKSSSQYPQTCMIIVRTFKNLRYSRIGSSRPSENSPPSLGGPHLAHVFGRDRQPGCRLWRGRTLGIHCLRRITI
ncbi:hypothetical protein N7G274_008757 [Stereocaulon virgatum]|uniref:Uncharacterized protein n=1 Tax=Stereocaulon virgatum TaxID=373712 RepID=A0ABR4A057_9LECA